MKKIYDEAFGCGLTRFLIFASHTELASLFPIERIICTSSGLLNKKDFI
jgi:hypothetical protein